MTLHVAWVTTCRSDYGACYWPLRDLGADARFRVSLLVGGAHLSARHGATVAEIEADGMPIAARLSFLEEADDTQALARSNARAATAFVEALRSLRSDVLVLYGDRIELLAAASAAVVTGTPIAHLSGGDVTKGVLDDEVRQALSLLAHVHFPSTAASARRLRGMGLEDARIHLSGDPSIDQFVRGERATARELEQALGFAPDASTLVVTFHPATLELDDVPRQAAELVAALEDHPGGIVVTAPAPDPGADEIRAALLDFAARHPRARYVESLGSRRYRGLLRAAGAMVGNSSSGLSEAPCVPLPAVNVGRRQEGRDRAANVIDVPAERGAIRTAIRRALAPEFRRTLQGLASPYGDGHAAARIVDVLSALPPRPLLLAKRRALPTATRSARPRVTGGDFPIDPRDVAAAADAEPPFSTARGALVALHRQRRPGRWLIPDFMCAVVPKALREAGAEVAPYPWLTPWRVDPDALTSTVRAGDAVLVPFHMGLDPDPAVWAVLEAAGALGVEDRVHCVDHAPAPSALRGALAVGSYRKWLPVPDGAYCVARDGAAPRPSAQLDDAMVALRLEAALIRHLRDTAEAASLDRVLEPSSVELFRRGEQAALPTDAAASATSADLVRRADVAAVRSARLTNQRALLAGVGAARAVEVLEPHAGAAATTPMLALAVLCQDRERVWRALADQRVFCAVHWRDGDWSAAGGRPAQWAARSLSLPIDQRYGPEDMQRIAEVLARCG